MLDEFPDDEALARWITMAGERVAFQGLPARICWLGYGERHRLGLRFNEMVRLWRSRGHEVKVLAGQVSYTSGARAGAWRASSMERGLHGEEVHRLYTPETYQRGVAGRAWSAIRSIPAASPRLNR